MSDLDKTTIIPGGDAKEVLNKPILKIIVLVDNREIAQYANDAARRPPTPVDFQVIWFKNPNLSEIKNLIENIDDNLDDVIAFSISTKNRAAYYIRQGSRLSVPIFRNAFIKAGYAEHNK